MASEPDDRADDEALHWAGDEAERPVLPRGWTAKGRGADHVATDGGTGTGEEAATAGEGSADVEPTDEEPPSMGNVALVTLGVLGGVYLLFAFGWLVGGLRLLRRVSAFSGDPMFLGAMWLSVLAGPLWFATTILLTRNRRSWIRLLWLLAGAVLLVPWPFLMTGVMAL